MLSLKGSPCFPKTLAPAPHAATAAHAPHMSVSGPAWGQASGLSCCVGLPARAFSGRSMLCTDDPPCEQPPPAGTGSCLLCRSWQVLVCADRFMICYQGATQGGQTSQRAQRDFLNVTRMERLGSSCSHTCRKSLQQRSLDCRANFAGRRTQ